MIRNENEYQAASTRLADERTRLVEHRARLKAAGLNDAEIKRAITQGISRDGSRLKPPMGFAWYVRNIGHYNVMYGSVGAGIALLVWMYVLAIIALIGCEFNAEFERASMRR